VVDFGLFHLLNACNFLPLNQVIPSSSVPITLKNLKVLGRNNWNKDLLFLLVCQGVKN
jgi:hypothetical protein